MLRGAAPAVMHKAPTNPTGSRTVRTRIQYGDDRPLPATSVKQDAPAALLRAGLRFDCCIIRRPAPYQLPHLWNTIARALFSSPRNLKSFQNFLSHRILRHMHEALNIDENKN